MIYITGDTHSSFARFRNFHKSISKDDYMIVTGDLGGWDEERMDFLESLPFTVLFVDGNHEDYSLLKFFPVDWWNGGYAQKGIQINEWKSHPVRCSRITGSEFWGNKGNDVSQV